MNIGQIKVFLIDALSEPVAVGIAKPATAHVDLCYQNPAFTERFGVSAETVFAQAMRKALAGLSEITGRQEPLGSPENLPRNYSVLADLETADGTRLEADLSINLLEDTESGGIVIYAVFRSVSVEEEVRLCPPENPGQTCALPPEPQSGFKPEAEDETFCKTADALAIPAALYDRNHKLLFCNRAFAALFDTGPPSSAKGLMRTEILKVCTGEVFASLSGAAGISDTEAPSAATSTIQFLSHKNSGSDTYYQEETNYFANGRQFSVYHDVTNLVGAIRASQLAHDRLISALNAYPDPVVFYDSDLKLIYRNGSYAASVTDTPEKLVAGMHLREVLQMAIESGKYPGSVGREEAWVNQILSADTLQKLREDIELDGDTHHRIIRSKSDYGDYLVIRLNSTELVRQKRAAEAAQARLIAALNAYPAPFVIYDSNDCLVVCNDAYRASMSNNPDDLKVGMHRTEVGRIAIEAGKIANAIGKEEEWMSDAHQSIDVAKPVQDLELPGDVHHRLLRSRVENGDLVILRIDTTELVRQRRAVEQYSEKLEAANREITHMALHDDLTGLGNRRYLSKKFEELVQKRQEHGGEIAALHIDLDRFKDINDTMGHAAGDDVLLHVAKRIRGLISDADILARIGGDEFVILLHVPETSDRPELLAEALLKDLSRPTLFDGKECRFGASVGLARTPLAKVDQLLTNSDLALYKAKRQGRGRVGLFDRRDLEDVHRNKELADDMFRAIENFEFAPFYQPQVDAKTRQIVGIEVLARWRHPTRGILSPEIFLPAAAELGVTGAVDHQIFEKALAECRQAYGTHIPALPLSFNINEKQIDTNNIAALGENIRSFPARISFELLETIFLEEQDDGFLARLEEIRKLGIAIEVDDFGSGRASVIALQRINPDRIKIDRRLTAVVAKGSGGLQLLRSIIEIGHTLDMGVTAEGVETNEQAKILTALGCDRLQGFLFAKPMQFNALCRFLDSHKATQRGRQG